MTNKEFFKDIKIVGFDFDNTLVDEDYSIRQRWQHILKEYSCLSPCLERTFFKIYKQRGPLYKFHLDDTLKKLKIDGKITKEIVSKFLAYRNGELLFKGTLELLKLLKTKNIKTGIITDGKQSYQTKRIKKAGIYKFMDFIYYGHGKRESKERAFKKCLKSLSLESPRRFLYVGDDFVNDIRSASSIGAKACWVTREKFMPEINKVIKIQTLRELLKYFKKFYG